MKPQAILKATFVFAAFASFVASVSIYFAAGDDLTSHLNVIYVGVWVPSVLALGATVRKSLGKVLFGGSMPVERCLIEGIQVTGVSRWHSPLFFGQRRVRGL